MKAAAATAESCIRAPTSSVVDPRRRAVSDGAVDRSSARTARRRACRTRPRRSAGRSRSGRTRGLARDRGKARPRRSSSNRTLMRRPGSMPEISQARPRQRPSRLMKSLGVQDGVELLAHGRIDVGDVAVECRPQRARAEQAREGLAEPRLQRAREVQTAMQECRQLGGGVGMPVTEEPAGQDGLAQRPARLGCSRALSSAVAEGPAIVLRQPWCRRSRPARRALQVVGCSGHLRDAGDHPQTRGQLLDLEPRPQVGDGVVGARLAGNLLHLDLRFGNGNLAFISWPA